MGRGRAHQLAHVLHGGLAVEAVGALELAHAEPRLPRRAYGAFDWTGISSVVASMRACSSTEIALSSPRIQARL